MNNENLDNLFEDIKESSKNVCYPSEDFKICFNCYFFDIKYKGGYCDKHDTTTRYDNKCESWCND